MNNTMYETVKTIMLENRASRDSDPLLCFYYYQMTDNKFAPSKEPSMSVNEYFENLHYKKMPTYSSISRARRKVQEDYPELRGSLYRYKKENTKNVKKWVHQTKDNQRDKNKLIEAGLKYGKKYSN